MEQEHHMLKHLFGKIPPGTQQSPPVAAQDLTSVFKAGYLEKRRKGQYFSNRITLKLEEVPK